jgi:hypothetical protein
MTHESRAEVGGVIPPEDLTALRKISVIGDRDFIILTIDKRELLVAELEELVDVHTTLPPEQVATLLREFLGTITPRASALESGEER